MTDAGQVLRGRYEVDGRLGEGGQATVVRARDTVHGRRVAIKVRPIDATTDLAAVLAEGATLLGMRPHPGVVVVREDFVEDDSYHLVMDFVDGRSLRDAPPDPHADRDATFDAIAQLAAAVDHLHRHDPPIVHGDISPANVVRADDGHVVLVDFGGVGTAGYAAPELADGRRPTAASDVYSFCATAFRLLTGATPMPGLDDPWRHLHEADRERVAEALAVGLAVDPSHRPSSAGEVAARLIGQPGPSTLPADRTSFVGRGAEVAALAAQVAVTGAPRVLTLLGPGGVGKSRLAQAVGRAVASRCPAGVDWVPLGALPPGADPAAFAGALVRSLGLDPATGSSPTDLAAAIGALRPELDGPRLLVLDTCEHVVDAAAALVDALVEADPRASVLATSRTSLDVRGEAVWRVQPLGPADAGALLVARASRARLDAPPSAQALEPLLALLEGVPLAIELAAARLRDADVGELVRQLEGALGRVDALHGGDRTDPRQRSIRATVDWSLAALDDTTLAAAAALSVVRGTFDDRAAAHVADEPDAAAALEAASLLQPTAVGRRMLDAVRERVVEWAADRDDLGAARAAAAERLGALGLEIASEVAALARTDERAAAAQYEAGRDVLWSALDGADDGRSVSTAARLYRVASETGDLGRLLARSGPLLRRPGGSALDRVRLARNVAASMWRLGTDHELLDVAEAAARPLADDSTVGIEGFLALGEINDERADHDGTMRWAEAAERAATTPAEAIEALRMQQNAIIRSRGNGPELVHVVQRIYDLAVASGEATTASTYGLYLGQWAVAAGDLATGIPLVFDDFARRVRTDGPSSLAMAVWSLAEVVAALDVPFAARLAGAGFTAYQVRESHPQMPAAHEQLLAMLVERCGDEVLVAAEADAGSRMALDDIAAEALAWGEAVRRTL